MTIAAPEKKEETPQPPKTETPPAPQAPVAPVETIEQVKARHEKELKDRDTKINDLSTTIQTIEQRQRELETKNRPAQPDEIEKELEEIENLRLTDPAEAAKRNAALLRKVSDSAAQRAQGLMNHQSKIQQIRDGVKSSNPDFDDEVLDYVMERADKLAATGKYKTADEAVQAAVTLVKSKFDGYAQKKNSTPPLPPGAAAETGPNPPPAPAPKDEPLPTPAEELSQRREAMNKKIL